MNTGRKKTKDSCKKRFSWNQKILDERAEDNIEDDGCFYLCGREVTRYHFDDARMTQEECRLEDAYFTLQNFNGDRFTILNVAN